MPRDNDGNIVSFPAKVTVKQTSDKSGMSRTVSAGLPSNPLCQDGFGQPAQVPLTTPGIVAAPVAQALGPPPGPDLGEQAREHLGRGIFLVHAERAPAQIISAISRPMKM